MTNLRYYTICIVLCVCTCITARNKGPKNTPFFKYSNKTVNSKIFAELNSFKLDTLYFENGDTVKTSDDYSKFVLLDRTDVLHCFLLKQHYSVFSSHFRQSPKHTKLEFCNTNQTDDIYLIGYVKLSDNYKSLLFEVHYDSRKYDPKKYPPNGLFPIEISTLCTTYLINFDNRRVLSIVKLAYHYIHYQNEHDNTAFSLITDNNELVYNELYLQRLIKFKVDKFGKIKLTPSGQRIVR
jgi:hypothetical protein